MFNDNTDDAGQRQMQTEAVTKGGTCLDNAVKRRSGSFDGDGANPTAELLQCPKENVLKVKEEEGKRLLNPAEHSSSQHIKKIISLLPSKKSFRKVYKELYCKKENAKCFYLNALIAIERTIRLGEVNEFKNVCKIIDYVHEMEDINWLKEFYDHQNNPLKESNLIILACMYSKITILQNLMDGQNKILHNLSVALNINELKPNDADKVGCNALYYAIRSNNVDLLNILIDEWSSNYFKTDTDINELDNLISKAYADLKLKNVLLSEEMQTFVENKLINIRFYFNTTSKNLEVQTVVSAVRERIDLVIYSYDLLKTEYCGEKDVDEKFIFIASFIAQNIQALKRQLKSTYSKLPWEEIEFCLICFVSAHINHEEINLIYKLILTNTRILNHLENFVTQLQEEKSKIQEADINGGIPKLKRVNAIKNILSKNPKFSTLYSDFEKIRNTYTLRKIVIYIELALSCNPIETKGQLVIERTLVVTGEYLKNTLESPNLSDSISEILLSSGLRQDTLTILRSIRNLLSHSFSLSKRLETEKTDASHVFSNIQNDLKKIKSDIAEILLESKLIAVRELFQKILDSDNYENIMKLINICKYSKFDKMNIEDTKSNEQETIEKLVKELKEKIKNKTLQQEKMFQELETIMNNGKSNMDSSNRQFNLGLAWFSVVNKAYFASVNVSEIKFAVKNILNTISKKIENESLEKITYLTSTLYKSVKTTNKKEKIQNLLNRQNFKNVGELLCKSVKDNTSEENKDCQEIEHLILKICNSAHFKLDHVKGLEALKIKYDDENKTKNIYFINQKEFKCSITKRLQTLKNILSSVELQSSKLSDQFHLYEKDVSLQVATEMLIFDILEIHKNYLTNNQLLFDTQCPLLIGKALRNHLAHGNSIVDVVPYNSLRAVFVNAVKFNDEGKKSIIQNNKVIGQPIPDDLFDLKKRFNANLNLIINQTNIFEALKTGNFEQMKKCINNGAEIKSRDRNKRTTLHFAASGGNLEIVKILLDNGIDANSKDINGQNSLYMAVNDDKLNIVQYFIEDVGLSVDNVDNDKNTVLHVAAKNGYKNIVEYLLNKGAKTLSKDTLGFAPVHLAIINNREDVVKTLLRYDPNVDYNEVSGGFTPLHIAAEHGQLGIVEYLLLNNANVNAKNDNHWIPLHGAALKGFLNVIKALILKGSDVNAKAINGCTPLQYAAESGFADAVQILIEHGANVNNVDNKVKYSALHYSCKVGNEDIVEVLLSRNANVHIKTIEGMTALHLAAQNGHVGIVKALLKKNADVHAKYVGGATALDFAIQGNHTEVVDCLLTKGANANSSGHKKLTPLHLAALNNSTKIIGMLLNKGANINAICSDGNSPLILAIVRHNADAVKLLLENGADHQILNKEKLMPIHLAALHGCTEIVQILIDNNIDVDSVAYSSESRFTPLHCAALNGSVDAARLLIENGADVKALDYGNYTPLHAAIVSDSTEIVKYLIEKESNIDHASLEAYMRSAIWHGNTEIVKILLQNGAKPSVEQLHAAIIGNYDEIANIFIKSTNCVNEKSDNITPLALAALNGNKEIIKMLLDNGANINIDSSFHPLYLAAYNEHVEIVLLLIKKGAEVNAQSCEGSTALHMAAGEGHNSIVEVLLKHGANIDIKDNKNRTPLELAIANNRIFVIKMLFQQTKGDINKKGNDDWSLLHVAAQAGNYDIVEYLINKGADIHAKNSSGSKPIHIAAREGHYNVVDLFLSKGLSINETGAASQTLLHYAALKGHMEVVKHLLKKSINVNAKDANGETPLHIAANYGCSEVVQFLLQNSAIYNALDKFYRTPLQVAKNDKVIKILESTKKLFGIVKSNEYLEIKKKILHGACTNATDSDHVTPLHYAAWKGYYESVESLLKNEANVNVIGKNGSCPLHYAVKFNHFKVVQCLLSNGAIYNAIDHNERTPLYFAENSSILSLLKLIEECFENIRKCKLKVIDILNTVKDVDIMRALMNTLNREGQTLVVSAIHNNFPKVKEIKELLQKNVSLEIDRANYLLSKEEFQEALAIFERLFQTRKDIFGANNPATLDIQSDIATVLYKQRKFEQSLELLNEIYKKQTDMLGINYIDTLKTRNAIGLTLHRLGRNEEALVIYKEVCQKQQKILGLDNSITLSTQLHMALVLDSLKRFDEALNINKVVFQRGLQKEGPKSLTALAAQNNIAMVLNNQEKYEESLKSYNDVYERKKRILGPHHSDTLRTLHNIGTVLMSNKEYDKALKAFNDVLDVQKSVLGINHLDTLNTQTNIANVLFAQGKIHGAIKIYTQFLEQRKSILSENHPDILDTIVKIDAIKHIFELKGQYNDIEEDNNIHAAVNDCDTELVKELLSTGISVNTKDDAGRTPLHFAVHNENISLVKLLLENGADASQTTKKGNTPLHTAASKGAKDIVEFILQHVKKLSPRESGLLVDAQTKVGCTTALHLSAQNHNHELVVILLQNGACYDIKNAQSKTPLDLSKSGSDTELFLSYIKRFFESVRLNQRNKIEQLLDEKYFLSSHLRKAVLNARESCGKRTLIQVAQKEVAKLLLQKLRDV